MKEFGRLEGELGMEDHKFGSVSSDLNKAKEEETTSAKALL